MIELPPPPTGKISWPWTEESYQSNETMPDGSPWPRISIVTPSYNQGQFLEVTIRSVLLQGYPNLEYIIIDGGSTDGSVQIIKTYEPWLSYWGSEPDKGQSHAINKGWNKSTGELLAWINSDDLYTSNAFFRAAISWEKNSRPGFISSISNRIDKEGNIIGERFCSKYDLVEVLLSSKNCIAQQSTFINRESLKKVGMLDENLHMAMDWDLWLRIAANFPVVFIPEVWSKFRIWEKTKTSTISKALAAPEHILITNKLRRNYHVKGMNWIKWRKSLSVAYGHDAYRNFHISNYRKFRKSFILSLLYYPSYRDKREKKFFIAFIFGIRTLNFLVRIKRIIVKHELTKKNLTAVRRFINHRK